MKKTFLLLVSIPLFLFFTGLSLSDLHAEVTSVTIGTGGVTGVFYQVGGAISQIVNKKRQEYGFRCVVESTSGSVHNIDAVVSGDLDFGVVQSDRQYQAVRGQAEWQKKGPQAELRSVFSVHSEACTLCAAVDAEIQNIMDLKGKRVNIGNPGSGHRQNAIDALSAAGIDDKNDLIASEINADDAPRMLQEGKIDAFFYTVGHPTAAIIEATSGKRKVSIIPMPVVANKLTAAYPYYTKTKIFIEDYRGAVNKFDADTFGVKATLVTSAKASNMLVYTITKEIFENINFFKSLHIAFQNLDKKEMLQNLTAPIHPGAMRYYKEAGLVGSEQSEK